MSILHCTITTAPYVDAGAVAFVLLHEPTGEAFLCRMASFEDVNVTLLPEGLTPPAQGDIRGVVAEAALHYAERNVEELAPLFEQLSAQPPGSAPE